MFRFDGISQCNNDNLKIVSSNLEDVYEMAFENCESANYDHCPKLNTWAADGNLEDRMAAL